MIALNNLNVINYGAGGEQGAHYNLAPVYWYASSTNFATLQVYGNISAENDSLTTGGNYSPPSLNSNGAGGIVNLEQGSTHNTSGGTAVTVSVSGPAPVDLAINGAGLQNGGLLVTNNGTNSTQNGLGVNYLVLTPGSNSTYTGGLTIQGGTGGNAGVIVTSNYALGAAGNAITVNSGGYLVNGGPAPSTPMLTPLPSPAEHSRKPAGSGILYSNPFVFTGSNASTLLVADVFNPTVARTMTLGGTLSGTGTLNITGFNYLGANAADTVTFTNTNSATSSPAPSTSVTPRCFQLPVPWRETPLEPTPSL